MLKQMKMEMLKVYYLMPNKNAYTMTLHNLKPIQVVLHNVLNIYIAL